MARICNKTSGSRFAPFFKPARGLAGYFVFFLAVLLAFCPAPRAESTPEHAFSYRIEDIRRGQQGALSRVVVETNRPVAYRAFLLSAPNRLVLDVPRAAWRAGRSGTFDDPVLAGYRSGALDAGLTRIVFDLKKPAVVHQVFSLLPAAGGGHRLVIDLSPVTQQAFNDKLAVVHGDAGLRRSPPAEAEAARPKPPSGQAFLLPSRKPSRISPPPSRAAERRVVVIDAGHGGRDPGAVAGRIHEKDITLAMARRLKQELEGTGRYTVHLTRDGDAYLPLRQRVEIARARKADLFLSLHADKIDRANVRGASVYTLSENASDAETARLAERENLAGIVSGVDLSGEQADVADILLDLAMRETMNESNLLARYLVDSLRGKNIRLLQNPHRSAGFAVLKAPDVPSALIELGFLSHKDEANLLITKDFQEKMAIALRRGIDAYFSKIIALQKI